MYIAPQSDDNNASYEAKNLGLPVQEVSQYDFISNIFGKHKGFLCIFQKTSKGIKRNVFYRNKEHERLRVFLHKTFGIDTYISYSTYNSKKKTKERSKLRTQDNIVHTYMLVQDLDYYKIGIKDPEFLQALGDMIRMGDILCPSYIISTGRGYQLIWLVEPFKNIKNYTNDKHWRLIQNHLFNKLKEFNSDDVVKNPSAVVRLAGTKHRVSQNKVYAYLANMKVFDLKDFLFFHDIVPLGDRKVLPSKQRNSKKQENKQITRLVDNWNEFTLNRQRENDIFTFVTEQNRRGTPYHAKRNWLALVMCFHALVSSDGDKDYTQRRLRELLSIMDLTETSEDEITRRSFQTAITYYEDWVNGTWDKEKYLQGGLFYRNKTMVNMMGIETDYYIQWKMKTIKIKNKAYEAARKRFEKYGEKEANNHTWEAYQERRTKKFAIEKESNLGLLQKAIERHPDWNNKQLAEHLNVSDKTIQRWKKSL